MPCGEPHVAEAFGVTPTAKAGLTQHLLDDSCISMERRLTRMPDPSAAGALQVRAAEVHSRGGIPVAGLGDQNDFTGFAACLAVASPGRLLGGSLLNLGAGPVPWAH